MTFWDKAKLFFYDPVVSATYSNNEVLTLIHKSGRVEKYHGSCTVWTTYPDMYDVGTLGEGRLYRYWKLCNHSKNGAYEQAGN